jgi:cytochrome b6
MSVPVSILKKAEAEKKEIPAKPMFPHLLWHDMVNCLLLLGLVVTLAVVMPSELEQEIDYLKPAPEGVKPDWFFLWVYQILKWLPTFIAGIEGEVVGIVGIAVAASIIAFAPFIDRRSQRGEQSPAFTILGILSLLVFVICTLMGYFS